MLSSYFHATSPVLLDDQSLHTELIRDMEKRYWKININGDDNNNMITMIMAIMIII